MIEGLMEQEIFADLAKYPRFDRAYYVKVYCETLKEYMKEIHILYNPRNKIKLSDLKDQSAIDAAYSESKFECDIRLADAKRFITCIYLLHV